MIRTLIGRLTRIGSKNVGTSLELTGFGCACAAAWRVSSTIGLLVLGILLVAAGALIFPDR